MLTHLAGKSAAKNAKKLIFLSYRRSSREICCEFSAFFPANEQKDTLRGRTGSGVLPFSRRGGVLALPGSLVAFFDKPASLGFTFAGALVCRVEERLESLKSLPISGLEKGQKYSLFMGQVHNAFIINTTFI